MENYTISQIIFINSRNNHKLKQKRGGYGSKMGMVVLAIICGIILLVLLLRKRAQIILNFLVRTVLGAIMILLVNDILQKQGFDIYVGLNPVTLLTSGTLDSLGLRSFMELR